MRNTSGDTRWLPANQGNHLDSRSIIRATEGFAKENADVRLDHKHRENIPVAGIINIIAEG